MTESLLYGQTFWSSFSDKDDRLQKVVKFLACNEKIVSYVAYHEVLKSWK